MLAALSRFHPDDVTLLIHVAGTLACYMSRTTNPDVFGPHAGQSTLAINNCDVKQSI